MTVDSLPGMIKQEFPFTIHTFSRGRIMKTYQTAVSHYPEKAEQQLCQLFQITSPHSMSGLITLLYKDINVDL